MCGIQHVLSRRIGSGLAPGTESADNRAVRGAAAFAVAEARFELYSGYPIRAPAVPASVIAKR